MAVKKINCYGCEHRLKKENEVSNADGMFMSRREAFWLGLKGSAILVGKK